MLAIAVLTTQNFCSNKLSGCTPSKEGGHPTYRPRELPRRRETKRQGLVLGKVYNGRRSPAGSHPALHSEGSLNHCWVGDGAGGRAWASRDNGSHPEGADAQPLGLSHVTGPHVTALVEWWPCLRGVPSTWAGATCTAPGSETSPVGPLLGGVPPYRIWDPKGRVSEEGKGRPSTFQSQPNKGEATTVSGPPPACWHPSCHV